ncbi:hypothetical protein FHG87_019565 [Trinorchestia longiramus]|nr:hypothetical protein FHG87_019565 [Trinorchestia longiramus]
MKLVFVFLLLAHTTKLASALWCYQCVSSHPGCGLEGFDWRFYWSSSCHDPNDVCVKVIEQAGSDVVVTRDCLSSLEGHRRDIPNDRYEGCRPATKDVQLGTYIFPSVPEIDNTRTYYDNVTFCFCSFDERCNGASAATTSWAVLLLACVAVVRGWVA